MYTSIKPGQEWNDTNGSKIEAHGGTMFIENETYYWLGEDKSHTTKEGKIWTWGIALYSSKDLYNWKYEGHIINPQPDDPNSIFNPARYLDRPHLIKCKHTGKYVLWLKFSDEMEYAILTSDNIKGPYELVRESYQPYGHKCGDFDLAIDEKSGNAYLYFETDHTSLLVCKLNESYTSIEGEASVIYENILPPLTREGPAHFIRNGKHYLITSGMSNYVPNPSETTVSDDYMGPFTVQGNPCINDHSSATFNSQIACIFKVLGKKDAYIAMADRWVPDIVMTDEKYNSLKRAIQSHYDSSIHISNEEKMMLRNLPLFGNTDTYKSKYVWLPITFEEGRAVIVWKDEWKIDDVFRDSLVK